MTNNEIRHIAMNQSAIDSNCRADDFLCKDNKIVISGENPNARRYLELPFYCDLTSYGYNIVASVREDLVDVTECYINKYSIEHCFETPNLHALMESLKSLQLNICFMAEYFLPDMNIFDLRPCGYDMKILQPDDFAKYYLPEWGNALSKENRQFDVLAVGAFHNGKLIGLAGCSADCDDMWQIGVDVLPEYRLHGVASSLTSKLALEVIKKGKVPFYCCAWSNIKSARNAIKSGFRPAWVQVTAKKIDFITNINK